MKTFIVVNLQHEGLHSWPHCPFEEVSFLRDTHRHVFHFRAVKVVAHEDREVEIIMLKRQMKKWVSEQFGSHFGTRSCETIAKMTLLKFNLRSCEVLEDGENGALVEQEI